MKILIVRNKEQREATEAAFTLCAYLDTLGYEHCMVDSSDLFGVGARKDFAQSLAGPVHLTVVLGGDGTIIRTAAAIRSASPIVGINFGHLGFLANASDEGVIDLVTRALAGELHPSRRSCLDVIATFEDSEDELQLFAVNEASVTRGASGSILRYGFSISDVPMADLNGDGLIVATATGSTAYAMAAGGPLVTPEFSGMVVQPLAPHTLVSRAILADANDVVEITFKRPEDRSAATLFVDGDAAQLQGPLASVRVQRSADDITLLYAHADHFLHYTSEKFFRLS